MVAQQEDEEEDEVVVVVVVMLVVCSIDGHLEGRGYYAMIFDENH